MKKLTKFYDKIDNIIADLQEVADEIEDKRDLIEEHANEMDRDMTDKEQERYDELDQQLSDVNDCIDYLDSAKEYIEEYCEW